MQKQICSKSIIARQSILRVIAVAVVCMSLMIGVAWPMSASGQVTSQGAPPAAGMGATSPLAMQSTRPMAVPLAATEITTPGISPIDPSRNMGMASCTGDAEPQAAPFDGGGLSGIPALSCADSQNIPSPLPSPSAAGRVGIPLGATELGSIGLSPATSMTGPNVPGTASPPTNPGNP